jgi:hypothetical protein
MKLTCVFGDQKVSKVTTFTITQIMNCGIALTDSGVKEEIEVGYLDSDVPVNVGSG